MKAVLLLGFVLAACGGSGGGDDRDGGGGGGDGGGGGPTITLGGGVTAVLPALAVGSKNDNDTFSTIGVSITGPAAPVTSASISIRLNGAPQKGTYPPGEWLVGTLEASTSDGKSWSAFQTPPTGSLGTLTIGSVAILSKSGNLTLYTIHGSLTVSTLVPAQGTTGLTMTSSF